MQKKLLHMNTFQFESWEETIFSFETNAKYFTVFVTFVTFDNVDC